MKRFIYAVIIIPVSYVLATLASVLITGLATLLFSDKVKTETAGQEKVTLLEAGEVIFGKGFMPVMMGVFFVLFLLGFVRLSRRRSRQGLQKETG